MRIAVLTITLLFIVALGVLTGLDMARYGVTVVGVLSVLILLLFSIGILGALRERPGRDD